MAQSKDMHREYQLVSSASYNGHYMRHFIFLENIRDDCKLFVSNIKLTNFIFKV